MPPAATMDEVHVQLNKSINHKPLHTFLYSSSPSHNILPIPRLLELLKLPQSFNPVHLPEFLMAERETCPEELISRLMMMSKEENILLMLATEDIIKQDEQFKPEILEPVKKDEESQPTPTKINKESKEVDTQIKIKEVKSQEFPQPEILKKDKIERDTSNVKQVGTSNASALQLKADGG